MMPMNSTGVLSRLHSDSRIAGSSERSTCASTSTPRGITGSRIRVLSQCQPRSLRRWRINASKFVLDSSGFTNNNLAAGDFFSISTSNNGSELDVNYVPEPSSFGLLSIGATAMLSRRRRRRRPQCQH